MTCFRLKIHIFLLMALATLLIGALVERYRPVGEELLLNPDFRAGLKSWQSFGPPGSVALQVDASVELLSESTDQNVSLVQVVPGLGSRGYLHLSGELATEGVVSGSRGWHRARLLLARYGQEGRWLELSHQVAALTGDHGWRHYGAAFQLEETAAETKVMLQLPHATGSFRAKGLSLRRAEPNPLFAYGQFAAFGGWGVFLGWLFVPYLQRGRGMALRLAMVLSVCIVLVGMLLPGDIKQDLLGEVTRFVGDVQPLLVVCAPPEMLETLAGGLQWFSVKQMDLSKIAHFVLFACLALALMVRPQRRFFEVFLDVLLVAAATELLQFFVVGRTPSIEDFLYDAAGVLFVLLVVACGRRVRGG